MYVYCILLNCINVEEIQLASFKLKRNRIKFSLKEEIERINVMETQQKASIKRYICEINKSSETQHGRLPEPLLLLVPG